MTLRNKRMTLSVETAARLLGVGRTLGYSRAPTGWLAEGIPILRIGNRLVVPAAPLARALGVAVNDLQLAAADEPPDDAA